MKGYVVGTEQSSEHASRLPEPVAGKTDLQIVDRMTEMPPDAPIHDRLPEVGTAH